MNAEKIYLKMKERSGAHAEEEILNQMVDSAFNNSFTTFDKWSLTQDDIFAFFHQSRGQLPVL